MTDAGDPRLQPVHPVLDRILAGLVVAAAVAVVWLLASVTPDARGHGTHEQLGMRPCGWATELHRPCPTCGVTTAAAQVVHLHPLRAFVVQPFGATLALLGLFTALVASRSLVTGEPFVARLRRWPYGRIVVGLVVLLFASWGYLWLTWPR
ncbi:MAG: DUF2752 domain-containing protein [Planctomycetes bacterium]|nr:DUF2752 domain-containing protein [Planctomycetota bacterium]